MDEIEKLILDLYTELSSLKVNVSINRYAIIALWTLEKALIVYSFNRIFKLEKK